MALRSVGRYAIKEELARGGMSTVYLAYDPATGRDVAIKVLPREFLHDPTFRTRFEREARVVARLEHTAIVPVYDFGEDNGLLYLVMQHMVGGSLGQRLARGPMSLEEALPAIKRVGAALDRAHKQDIVHRDLKPSNILFDSEGEAFLSDFGIVKMAESAGTLTGSGYSLGTPAYMSPEQSRALTGLDGRSDIYALGIILFEMLTGDVPYRADTPMGVALMHVMDPVPRILEARPDLSPTLESVISMALSKKREQRFTTCKALVEALENVLYTEAGELDTLHVGPEETVRPGEGEPSERTPKSAHIVSQPDVDRERRGGCLRTALGGVVVVLIASATLIAVLALSGALALGSILQSSGQESPLLPPPLVTSGVTEVAPSAEAAPETQGDVQGASLAGGEPTGRILFTCYVDNFDEVCMMNADGTNQQRLTVDPATDFYASFAPDGQSIVFTSQRERGFEIHVMSTTGENGVRLTSGDAEKYAPAFSPDGTRLVWAGAEENSQNIWVANSDASNALRITHSVAGDNFDPVWSPDGQRIAFSSNRSGSVELYTMDPDGTNVLQLTFGTGIGGRSDWSPDGKSLTFYAGPEGAKEIFLIDSDGSNLRQVTAGGDNKGPSFSLDGGWITYASRADGDNEIFIIRVDGSEARQLTFNVRPDYQPRWGP